MADTILETATTAYNPETGMTNGSTKKPNGSTNGLVSKDEKEYWSTHPEPSLFHRSLVGRPMMVDTTTPHHLKTSANVFILDACGGAGVSCIGHGNQEVISAIVQQLQAAEYVHTGIYTTTAAEELADILVGSRPGGLCKAVFVGSGSEAVDGAMKLARQYFFEKGEKNRTHYIARRQAFHGNTFGSMSISRNLSRLVPYHDILMKNASWVSPCYAYQYQHDNESQEEYVQRLAQELEDEFQRVGPGNVVAFVAETVGGATAGCITPVPGYFAAMKAVCTRHGALFILDEIMCGMGRTGTFFTWEEENVVPDIMTCGKGLGGGYIPLSAILVHERVVKQLAAGTGIFNNGHTFQAHPAACAGALAVQTIIRRDGLVARCAKMGKVLEAALQSGLGDEDHVGNIRGRGLFWAVEFVQDKRTKSPFDPSINFGPKVQERALEFGVNVYPGHGTIDGVRGDHILIAPPYTVTESEIDLIVSAVLKASREIVREVVE